jgi:hypothetical protein
MLKKTKENIEQESLFLKNIRRQFSGFLKKTL